MYMNEEKKIELIMGHLEGTLDARQQAELQQALNQGLIAPQELTGLQTLQVQLAGLPEPEPSPLLREGFYAMLQEQKQMPTQPNSVLQALGSWLSSLNGDRLVRQLAYSLVVLAVGVGVGYWLSPARSYESQLSTLTGEVQQMREMMLLTLLEQPSATERLRAVSLSTDLESADTRVTQALLQTLNNDPNVNVRLATIEALLPHAGKPAVREGLIQAIAHQESPLVQIALADVMVALQEKRSIEHLRQLLHREDLNGAVQAKVKESIEVLL
jgi:hypothetical protein